MNQRLAWYVVIILHAMLWGCTTHLDQITNFHIEGRVVDRESDAALQEAKVLFIDTGFDYVRSSNFAAEEVGQSSQGGVLNISFDYFWGWEKSFFWADPKKTFTLKIDHQGYEPLGLDLRAGDFQSVGNEVRVNVGVVTLRKNVQALPVR